MICENKSTRTTENCETLNRIVSISDHMYKIISNFLIQGVFSRSAESYTETVLYVNILTMC